MDTQFTWKNGHCIKNTSDHRGSGWFGSISNKWVRLLKGPDMMAEPIPVVLQKDQIIMVKYEVNNSDGRWLNVLVDTANGEYQGYISYWDVIPNRLLNRLLHRSYT